MKMPKLHQLSGVATVKNYHRSWLSRDIVAGIVLSSLLVPQGMAYAQLAGLPVITGLYATVLSLIGYAVFGPSRILVLGPDSSLGPIIATTIALILGGGASPEQAVGLASLLALLVGFIMALSGILRFGFVADLLSKPTRIGYMNGLAFTILIGQLPKLFGFSTDAEGPINEIVAFVQGVQAGEAIRAAVLVGLASLVIILVFKRFWPRIPGVLIAVLFAIAAVNIFDLSAKGIDVVGTLPQGFPPFTLPDFSNVTGIVPLFAGAFAITLVALTDTISTASAFASRTGQEVKGSGEMIGIGAANVAAGFFQGFPVSTSGSRTAVAEQAGAKTQLTGLVGAGVIVLMLVFFPGLFRNLPQPALGAVVIAASLSLADISGTIRLWKQHKTEFAISLISFLGVAFLGVLTGIAVAIVLSIFIVFKRAWWPHHAILRRTKGMPGYHDRPGTMIPGLVIFRFDAPLFFANARTFREQVHHLTHMKPRPKWIIIACEPITDLDTTAADMLLELDEKLNANGINLIFAELKDPIREKLQQYELIGPLNPSHFFPTIEAAVTAFKKKTGRTFKTSKN